MKRLIILFNIIFFSLSLFSQTRVLVGDVIVANEKIIQNDSTIWQVIQANSAASIISGSGITISGGAANLTGTLTQDANISGGANNMYLGTLASKLQNLYSYTSGDIFMNSDGVIELQANGITWEIVGNYIINQNTTDTLATLYDIATLIENNKQTIPFNFEYIYSATTTDSRPGSGYFRLNNATYSLVTEMYIDYFDVDAVDKSNFLDLIDTGSYFSITNGTSYINYQLTGATTDAGNYYKYEVTYKNNSGTISGTNTISVDLSSSGSNLGADSLYHVDSETWLKGGDTIPKADSTRDVFIANNYISSDTVKTNIVMIGDGTGDTFIDSTSVSTDTIKPVNNTDIVVDAELGLHRGDRINLSVEGNPFEIYQNNATQMSIENNNNDVVVLDYSASGGVLTTHEVITDTVTTLGLRIGGGDMLTSSDTIDLKTAVEQEDFDSLNMNGYFIRFNESEGVYEFETAKAGVVWQGALEDLIQFYNNSGVTIPNGYPVAFAGTVTGDSIPNGRLATNLSEDLSDAFVAISTIEVPDGEWGYATTRGFVRGVPADFDSVELWLGNYELIDSIPPYPARKVLAGIVIKADPTDGIIYASPSQSYRRSTIGKSYNFTTQGIGAGTYYRAGFYRAPAADANLTQASTTQAYGTANVAYSAHPFIVCGGAGSVDAGVVGLRITGTSIDDLGNYTVSDADTILTDITSVSTNEYYEAKKFLGTVTYELITMSGSPTTYSLDFNYGYAKYEDFGNRDAWVTGIEVVGLASASDASFNVELMYHTNTGWTYNATAFVPGNSVLASWDTDLGTKDDLSNGLPFAWKRTNVNTFIEGSGSEGIIVRITTGLNNSVQSMDINLSIALESE